MGNIQPLGHHSTMMIRNLELEPSLVADIVDPEGTVKLMTDAIDMYCDHVANPIAASTVDRQLEAIITTAILEINPHLKDRFYMTIDRQPGPMHEIDIKICKSLLQQHLEEVTTGARQCH